MADDEYVCWSRMQAEAGQALDRIVERKEMERRAGDGLFAWGVGNAPSRVAPVLARLGTPVRAIFSVMKGKPKDVDVSPGRVVAWRRYLDGDGVTRRLPSNVVVTSRADSATGAKRFHAALLCRSDSPLALDRGGPAFDPAAYVNAGVGGGPVGASQVTALLRRVSAPGGTADYRENIVADLTGGYWVRLLDPVELNGPRIAMLATCRCSDPDEWLELAEWIKCEDRPSRPAAAQEHALF